MIIRNPGINKALIKEKLDRIIGEIQSDKTFLTCGKHGYVAHHKAGGGVMPPQPRGCPDCWKTYYFTLHCLTAPHLRYEHLEELDEVVKKTIEMEKTGKLPELELFEPGDPRLKIEYEKDAE